jgi:hypothetical protein
MHNQPIAVAELCVMFLVLSRFFDVVDNDHVNERLH